MSWNMPIHHGHGERDSRNGEADARTALQNARTARTVAEHATDAEDCRILLDMLGLRLDNLKAEQPPTR